MSFNKISSNNLLSMPPSLHGKQRVLRIVIAGLILVFFALKGAFAQEVAGGCGSLGNAFGPFDYRPEGYKYEDVFRSHAAQLNIVERAHFTPEVEALVHGKSAAIGADIGYTLRAFPNHHRALLAMAALGDKEKTNQPDGSIYSIDCWFRRGIAWKNDDNIVRMIYASYLVEKKRPNEALEQLQIVANQAKDNAFTLQNVGLIYFDMKNYEKALFFARQAYALGLGIPTLKDQLKSVGKWVEPPEDPSSKKKNRLPSPARNNNRRATRCR